MAKKKVERKGIEKKEGKALTPVEIRRASFKSSLFGYSKGQVQQFLERVAKGYETVLNEKKSLEEQLAQLADALKEVEELRAQKNRLDEELLLLQQEVEVYKRQVEELQREGSSPAELEALREENRVLREELERLKAELEEAKANQPVQSPAQVIAIAQKAAQKLKEEAKASVLELAERLRELAEGL